jgi:hypothetical protein
MARELNIKLQGDDFSALKQVLQHLKEIRDIVCVEEDNKNGL